MNRPLRILLLADDQKGHPDTIHDHIRMFARYSKHDIQTFNPRGLHRSRFLDFGAFDVVALHYSIVVIWDGYLARSFREELARFQGLKVQFLQDEYRFVDEMTAMMRRLGIDVLYSVVPPDMIPAVYGDRLPDTEILSTLTGYVPERLIGLANPRPTARPIDVGYRGRSVPYWLGRLGNEKIEIGRGFLERAADLGLRCDIAWTEGARIYRGRWTDFMTSCRTMLASESGSSIVDYDGSVERAVRAYLAKAPSASYEDVEQSVLSHVSHGPSINTLSPRIFEAAAFRTGMVMFPGEYSGAVEPWGHYIPLEKDFSNIEEVAERVRDTRFLEELTTRAYDDLVGSARFSERNFVAQFDDQVADRAKIGLPRGRPRTREAFLRVEQAAAGRGYYISTLYGVARETILAYIGLKNALRQPSLRRLLRQARHGAPAPGASSVWDDLFRLAILTSVQRGLRVLACDPFHVVGTFDEPSGRLTLTSRPGPAKVPDGSGAAGLERAASAGGLREIVWNHASLDQYVPLRFGPMGVRIAFDVGRYDAYGVYRFDAIAALAQERPHEIVAALAPFIRGTGSADVPAHESDKKRGPET